LPQRALIPLLAFLFSKLGKKTGLYDIDSTALPVCHNRRIGRHQPLAGLAARGQTCRGWFFAFKLPLVCNDLPEIAALKLTPGHVADTAPVPALTQDLLGKRFGDQGYLGKNLAGERLRRGLTLFTRVRKNRKSLPLSRIDKMLLNGRPMADTIMGRSKGRASLHLPQHRLPSNAFLPILAALVAYQLDPIKPNHVFFSHRSPAITTG
jgi:Transposase DDE domain